MNVQPSPSPQTEPSSEALALLVLPDFTRLTDDQIRGAVCLWGTAELTAETAIPLPEQHVPLTWFPRACNPHVAQAAYRALHDHAPRCESCVDSQAGCEIGSALRRLALRGFRSQDTDCR